MRMGPDDRSTHTDAGLEQVTAPVRTRSARIPALIVALVLAGAVAFGVAGRPPAVDPNDPSRIAVVPTPVGRPATRAVNDPPPLTPAPAASRDPGCTPDDQDPFDERYEPTRFLLVVVVDGACHTRELVRTSGDRRVAVLGVPALRAAGGDVSLMAQPAGDDGGWVTVARTRLTPARASDGVAAQELIGGYATFPADRRRGADTPPGDPARTVQWRFRVRLEIVTGRGALLSARARHARTSDDGAASATSTARAPAGGFRVTLEVPGSDARLVPLESTAGGGFQGRVPLPGDATILRIAAQGARGVATTVAAVPIDDAVRRPTARAGTVATGTALVVDAPDLEGRGTNGLLSLGVDGTRWRWRVLRMPGDPVVLRVDLIVEIGATPPTPAATR
jgi:hypothetical protein